ncbi:glycosyl hydrolase 115 family protein [Lewinella sp. IMCC34191]|uniref:glycosyl hydrolase 115 family protein n=1 Tax=Lewinella sp. IMCC34191 TaxID=2259172 RepID=UPI000E279507|nr:glycosyl hydrolase 115 family protein [Lewinella sp. IMCC34191]
MAIPLPRFLLFLLVFACAGGPAIASDILIFDGQRTPTIYVAPQADSLIWWAARDLAADLSQMAGRKIAVETADTADRSATGIYVYEAPAGEFPAGSWENFTIRAQDNNLHVRGSDLRGTVYGIFDLAERLGVSPWKWWADVTPLPRESLTLELPDDGLAEGPSVKYRGIFLNDEDWGLQPWAANTFEPETGDIGPKTYEKIFQLLLRLKANTIWPAMHPSTRAFFSIPGNREMAERYHIFVGSSHAEPMLRNNVDEWDHDRYGEYNFQTNADTILNYWRQRVIETRADNYLYTVGMRGIHDSGMEGDATVEERVALLDTIISAQRRMLADEKGVAAESVPQVFVSYKEVLDLYDAGLKVPDDITLMWTDDNYGYIRRLSEGAERERGGGSGVYYHLSYWGRPHDYLWLSSTQPGLIWYEMQRAYANGTRDIWIANVGDIKPAEYNMEFFLDLAWDVEAIGRDEIDQHLLDWAGREFGGFGAPEIAALLREFYRLAMLRKPEFMGWSQTEPTTETRPAAFTSANGDELQRRIDAYRDLYAQSRDIAALLPIARRDAYFELVDYPVRGAALLNQVYGYATQASRANDPIHQDSLQQAARTAHEEISVLTNYYNDVLAGGKWNGMIDYRSRGLPVFDLPDFRDDASTAPSPATTSAPLPLPVAAYTTAEAPDTFHWETIPGLGYGGEALTLFPLEIAHFAEHPFVEYTFEVDEPGDYTIEVRCLPTHANDYGHALGVSVDGQETTDYRLNTRGRSEAWKQGVLGNHIPVKHEVSVSEPGTHTLRLSVNQTGIVIDQIGVYPVGYPEFYELRR